MCINVCRWIDIIEISNVITPEEDFTLFPFFFFSCVYRFFCFRFFFFLFFFNGIYIRIYVSDHFLCFVFFFFFLSFVFVFFLFFPLIIIYNNASTILPYIFFSFVSAFSFVSSFSSVSLFFLSFLLLR